MCWTSCASNPVASNCSATPTPSKTSSELPCIASHARLQGHPVAIDLPPDLPSVNVDPMLVSQVLANLLDNAAKYTPPGTPIRIAAVADEPMVRVVVEDEGPGLPPGDPRQLFKKFQRGRQESAVVGAGLGLAICRAIVSAHGGEISARPGTHGGARFEFTLPVDEAAP